MATDEKPTETDEKVILEKVLKVKVESKNEPNEQTANNNDETSGNGDERGRETDEVSLVLFNSKLKLIFYF